MNFLKRAIISIHRQPIKSSIFLVLILLLGTLSAGAIAVRNAIHQADQNLRRRMPAIATIDYDFDEDEVLRIYEETGEFLLGPNLLTPEILREIGNFPQVRAFDFSVSIGFGVTAQGLNLWEYFDGTSGWLYDEDLGIRLQVGGVASTELLNVRSDFIHLVEGRGFDQFDLQQTEAPFPVMISAGFAEVNDFHIGSTFDVQTVVFDFVPIEDGGGGSREKREVPPLYEESFTLEIVGIFENHSIELPEDLNDENFGQMLMWRAITEHRIYVSNIVAEAMFDVVSRSRFSTDRPPLNNLFLLNDPLDFPAFADEVENLPGNWIAVDYSRGFDDISMSMENLRGIASLILVMTGGATILLISLLVLLFLHDRKHEIGIYLALGEKKEKIIFQIMSELIPLAMIGLTLALFAGSIMADGLSRDMLRQELANPPSETIIGEIHFLEQLGYRFDLSHEEMLEAYGINMNVETILIFYVIGLGTVLIAVMIPISYVAKLSPKKVLL